MVCLDIVGWSWFYFFWAVTRAAQKKSPAARWPHWAKITFGMCGGAVDFFMLHKMCLLGRHLLFLSLFWRFVGYFYTDPFNCQGARKSQCQTFRGLQIGSMDLTSCHRVPIGWNRQDLFRGRFWHHPLSCSHPGAAALKKLLKSEAKAFFWCFLFINLMILNCT